jgi:hypothetical protein
MAKTRPGTQPQGPKVRSDAYVGLLAISLLAQITAAVLFYLDWAQYPTTKPHEAPAAGSAAPAGGPPQPGAQQGGGPPPQGGGAPQAGKAP